VQNIPSEPLVVDRAPRAVVDACVYPKMQRWLIPLTRAAQDGQAELLWSPSIIMETNRVLTWLWLERNGGDFSDQAWRRCSEQAHRMFAHLTTAFTVVEDRPPDEPLWGVVPPDQWDVAPWNAAVRGQADFVVTENLKDGPPRNARGVRRHQGVTYIHPDDFLRVIAEYADYGSWSPLGPTGRMLDAAPEALPPPEERGVDSASFNLPPEIEALLATVSARLVEQAPRHAVFEAAVMRAEMSMLPAEFVVTPVPVRLHIELPVPTLTFSPPTEPPPI
jgi:hypothetical protein